MESNDSRSDTVMEDTFDSTSRFLEFLFIANESLAMKMQIYIPARNDLCVVSVIQNLFNK